MVVRPPITPAAAVKVMINIGAGLDIPTGVWLKGKYGENLLKGGVPGFFGISGKANNFKSTILAWMLLTALYRLTKHAASLSWYDTEVNVELTRLAFLASNIEGYERFTEENGTVFDAGLWVFSDKGNMHGNKWVAALQDFLAEKVKQGKSISNRSPFLDLDVTFFLSDLCLVTHSHYVFRLKLRDRVHSRSSRCQHVNKAAV
jgi:hypothetical protein